MLEILSNRFKSEKIPPWFHNITKVYFGDIFSKVFTVGTLFLLIRGLSVGDYALFTVFYTVSVLTPSLIGGGINRAMVRFSAEQLSLTGEKPLELYTIGFLFQIVLYAVLCVVIVLANGDMLNTLLFGKKIFGVALNYGLIAGFGYLITQSGRSIYQSEERFGMYIKTLVIRQFSIFFTILGLFFLQLLDFQNAAKSIMVVELIIGVVVCRHIFRHFNIKMILLILRDRIDIVKDFLSASKWLIAYTVALVVFDRLNVFMLSHLSTEAELANFGVASRYFGLALLLLGSVSAVLLPLFSRVERQDFNHQRLFAVKRLKNTYWLIVPMTILFFLLKPFFIWVNGEQYCGAFYILLVLLPCIWIGLMFSPLINIIIARKKLKFLFLMSAVSLVTSFIGNYYLIPIWGGIAAAMVLLFSHALLNISCGLVVVFFEKKVE